MKKIFTLLWLTLTAFTLSASAQGTVCNAEFSVQYINTNTVKFNPVITAGAPTYQHSWVFGDGSPSSNLVSPTYVYAAAGTFTTIHTITKYNPNNIPECTQSFTKTVIIQNTCNLQAYFSSTVLSTNPLAVQFQNLSQPSHPTDSIKWTFGDGHTLSGVQGDSTIANPVHTYANPGTYTVCIRVKQNNSTTPNSCVREFCKTIVVTQPCTLVADFNSQLIDPANPLKIKFSNLSQPSHATDSVKWTFGDGTTVSGVQGDPNISNPVHTYLQAGTYTVCIRVKKNNNTTQAACVREFCRTIVVTNPCTLVANFTSQPDPNHPLRIKFTNTSTPSHATDSVKWMFGDGTSISGLQGDPNIAMPIHTYANSGTYTVCIRVKNNNTVANYNCVREFCRTIVVINPCNLQVYFTSQADPNHPLRIKFTNQSAPSHATDSLYWTFGDGTGVSGLQADPNVNAPTHNYTSPGTYTVCLRVAKSPTGTTVYCVREYCKTIIVTNPCNFQASFTWRLDSSNHKKVFFTNTTNAPAATSNATWTFGDGTTAAGWNAVHEYAHPGTYRVCLRVVLPGTNCVRETCDTVIIPNPPPACTELSKFKFEKFSNDNQKYKFTPDYLNTTLQYTWTFGDGTGSMDPIATHRYAQPGVYTACLTVWRGPNCASTTCKEIRVLPQVNCDSAHVTYSYQPNPLVPNKIHFYANSSMPILNQTWTITRLPASTTTPPVILNQNNPIYLFQDTGSYRVCLRAVLLGGCVKEVCQIIRIQQVANACELQAYPNPASTMVHVNVTLTQPEMIHAYVYNSMNVLVLDKHQQGVAGNNQVSLNVSNLSAGQYTIKLIYGNKVCIARFQKL